MNVCVREMMRRCGERGREREREWLQDDTQEVPTNSIIIVLSRKVFFETESQGELDRRFMLKSWCHHLPRKGFVPTV